MSIKKTPQSSVQNMVRAFWQEVSETKELARLLRKKYEGEPLTPAETEQISEQLIDLGKLLPLLTVLLLPGGALVILLLEKILPFSLLPSAFREKKPGEPHQ